MNDLDQQCPVCGGAMRLSEYSRICAQEHGPCGLLYHRKSGRGRTGGVTEFSHTTIKRADGQPWTRMRRHFQLGQFYAAGAPISQVAYMGRLHGKPVGSSLPGRRAVVIKQGEVKE